MRFLGLFLATTVPAAGPSGTVQSSRLYTVPDPSAGGGLHARVMLPSKPILQVFAIASDDPSRVYQGQVTGGREFSFRGLPVSKYDLLILYDDAFYEGMVLSRDPNTLTAADRDSIEKAIQKTVPFFEIKKIHRCEGTTGRAGQARCTLQELRAKPTLTQEGTVMPDTQIRSLKLAFAEDMGRVGWQLLRTREIVRQEVTGAMTKGLLTHHYRDKLGDLRVTDTVKELGDLNLE